MKALLRKELLETLIPALPVLLVAYVLAVTGISADEALLGRREEPRWMLLGCAGLFGLYAGFFRFAVETWSGAWPHLVHRGTGRGGIFLAKVVAGLVLTALASVGVVLFFALCQRTFSPLAPVLQWDRLREYACLATFGASAQAAGVLAAQIRRGPLASLALLVAMPAGLLLPSMLLAQRGEHAWFVVFQLAATLALLSIAYGFFRHPQDRDLALPARQHVALVLSGGLCFAVACAGSVAAVQNAWLRDLYERYPTFARDASSGRFRALPAHEWRDYFYDRHSAAQAPTTVYQELYQPRMSVSREPRAGLRRDWRQRVEELYVFPFSANYYLAANAAFRPRVFFDSERGVVRVVWLRSELSLHAQQGILSPDRALRVPDLVLPEPLPFERVAAKPGGRRFSAETHVLRDGGSVCLADPSDGSLTRIDSLGPAHPLVAVDLPDGDRFVALEAAYDRFSVENGRPKFQLSIVVGDRGRYVWSAAGRTPGRADGFVPFVAADLDLVVAADLESAVERRLIVSDPDPIAPVVEVRDAAGGELIARHTFAPDTAGEKAVAAALIAATLLRPTIVNLTSFFSVQHEPHELWHEPTPHREPLFAGRSRPLLLSLHVVLTLCAAASAVRDLRRCAAPRSVAALTVTLVGVFGLAGYVIHRMLEPRGARRLEPAASEPAHAPALRFESA